MCNGVAGSACQPVLAIELSRVLARHVDVSLAFVEIEGRNG